MTRADFPGETTSTSRQGAVHYKCGLQATVLREPSCLAVGNSWKVIFRGSEYPRDIE